MKYDTLYIVPKGTFGDKNDNLQFRSDVDMANEIKAIVCGIAQWGEYPEFKELSLFIQGDSNDRGGNWWIMIEHWSFNSDLFFDFCVFISNKFSLPLEIGLT